MSTLSEAWAALEQAFVKPTEERLRTLGWRLTAHERHQWAAERLGKRLVAMTPARLVELAEEHNARLEAERAAETLAAHDRLAGRLR